MPLFLCGRVEGPELLTNTPFTSHFPCASTLGLALSYSISSGTSVHFDPEDILCLLSSWSIERTKANKRLKIFTGLCSLFKIKEDLNIPKGS